MASLFDASMRKPVRKLYITRSGGQYRPDDVALAFALSLRVHDSADHLRRLARRLVDKVCLEHQPNMKRLAREPDDAKVFDAALKIINRVCDLLDIGPGTRFVRNGGDDGSDAEAARREAPRQSRTPAGRRPALEGSTRD
ncbi:hypothetical protein NPS42_14780 [Pseudomonas putida]|nr:hypothetical protein [Pseudomonas putida]MDD2027056.1 hypothetical protein [Pseudomonas putida]